jgi:ribosomal protein S26
MFTHDENLAMRFARFMPNMDAVRDISEDMCIRKVTAFKDMADLMSTSPEYELKLCLSKCDSTLSCAMMVKVARAFNREARKLGQARRALFY